ncbi:hypothetical protein BC939DRAFT_480248 [Gamsiella multidivaricata]|uniref:uncharacterized protein n=1 Tax=Gamsiella multidivaricata TaxID=101098 RepID=UPI00221FC1C1|nr:uncharacterized protein BC939DRAFT_480248 [Gamsiella multidivaricata]KAI7818583.1 hypothetical protein BC939DRAFT_480248 [Gamsiella multidivaricata]
MSGIEKCSWSVSSQYFRTTPTLYDSLSRSTYPLSHYTVPQIVLAVFLFFLLRTKRFFEVPSTKDLTIVALARDPFPRRCSFIRDTHLHDPPSLVLKKSQTKIRIPIGMRQTTKRQKVGETKLQSEDKLIDLPAAKTKQQPARSNRRFKNKDLSAPSSPALEMGQTESKAQFKRMKVDKGKVQMVTPQPMSPIDNTLIGPYSSSSSISCSIEDTVFFCCRACLDEATTSTDTCRSLVYHSWDDGPKKSTDDIASIVSIPMDVPMDEFDDFDIDESIFSDDFVLAWDPNPRAVDETSSMALDDFDDLDSAHEVFVDALEGADGTLMDNIGTNDGAVVYSPYCLVY